MHSHVKEVHFAVIESDDYRQEEETLKADPIVIAMTDEIRGDVTPEMCMTHNFMGHANYEYDRRGGKQAKSIGGVARAIKALLEQE